MKINQTYNNENIELKVRPFTFGLIKMIHRIIPPKQIQFKVVNGVTQVTYITKVFKWKKNINYQIIENL